MRFAAVILLLTSALTLRAAPLVIGSEAQITLPTSAEYSTVVNFRPGNGETVCLNPPRFAWTYATNVLAAFSDQTPKRFRLEVDDNADFSSPQIVVTNTECNVYNFLPPLTGGPQFYWRVGYFLPTNIANSATWLLGTNGYQTNAALWVTNTFTLSGDAVTWDRSSLANARTNVHPFMMVRTSDKVPFHAWLEDKESKHDGTTGQLWERQTGISWKSWKSDAATLQAAGGYPYVLLSSDQIRELLIVSQVTNLVDRLKLGTNLFMYCSNWMATGGSTSDFANAGFRDGLVTMAFGYDWLYDVLNTQQKSNLLFCMESRAAGSFAYNWYKSSADPVIGPFTVDVIDAPKFMGNHQTVNHLYEIMGAAAVYPDTTNTLTQGFWECFMSYYIGIGAPTRLDGGVGTARGYSTTLAWQGGSAAEVGLIPTLTYLAGSYPAANLQRNPIFETNANWYMQMWPVEFGIGHDSWGDRDEGYFHTRINPFRLGWGYFLASIASNSAAFMHQTNQFAATPWDLEGVMDPFHAVVYFKFPMPSTPADVPTATIYPTTGWAISSSKPVNNRDGYTNGVGFILQARPSGAQPLTHNHFTDGSFDLWAYGTTFTDSGEGGLSAFAKLSVVANTILVNGYGQMQPIVNVDSNPVFGKFTAWTNNADFTYVAADLTHCYPHSAYSDDTWLGFQTYAPSHTNMSWLTKVKRHILFPRKKYFVLFDEMAATEAVKFSWLYGCLENTMTNVNTNTVSWDYTSNMRKFVTGENTAAPNVKILFRHIAMTNDVDCVSLTGTDVYKNPIAGGDGWSSADQAYARKGTFWVSNRTPATNWHYMTVIFPVKPGDSDPTITRIDDYTVAVTNGAEGDVISFATNSSVASLIVDTGAQLAEPDQPPAPPTVVIRKWYIQELIIR